MECGRRCEALDEAATVGSPHELVVEAALEVPARRTAVIWEETSFVDALMLPCMEGTLGTRLA